MSRCTEVVLFLHYSVVQIPRMVICFSCFWVLYLMYDFMYACDVLVGVVVNVGESHIIIEVFLN